MFAAAFLLCTQNIKAASDSAAFDGTWAVTLDAHEFKNPDDTVARPAVMNFPANVKNGVLHGEWRSTHTTASLEIDGKIRADGTAMLYVNGMTADPEYTPLHKSNTPFKYQVIAHFDSRHGTGKSGLGSPRVHTLTFVKK
jgi:hypothetical protein